MPRQSAQQKVHILSRIPLQDASEAVELFESLQVEAQRLGEMNIARSDLEPVRRLRLGQRLIGLDGPIESARSRPGAR